MHKITYIPLERYKSRYTEYLSGRDGVFAECAEHYGNVQLDIIAPDNDLHEIKSGVVLDTTKRVEWGFAQTAEIINRIQVGYITSESVLYFEDFWHPGMEMIPYACNLAGIRPRAYAWCHAQSVDPFDFTYSMRPWMRHMERGWARWLTGIFVAAKELKHMMAAPFDCGQICEPEKIHVAGQPYSREFIHRFFPAPNLKCTRRKQVLFTSRLHPEKQPELFIELAGKFRRGDAEFAIVSGTKIPHDWLLRAEDAGITTYACTPKRDYFTLLATSAAMFNCAAQDFISFGLIDALAYGCAPMMPACLSFPDALGNNDRYLYTPYDIDLAAEKLRVLLDGENVTPNEAPLWPVYGSRYERSTARMLDVMVAAPPMHIEIAVSPSSFKPVGSV